MNFKSTGGFKRVVNATKYSMQGLKSAFKHESAFRQELAFSLIMLPVAAFIDVTVIEKLMLVLSVLLVLIVELLNSAIEATVDRFGGEIHPLSGQAKDIASAAVFISLVFCGLCWLVIVGPLLIP